MKFVGTLSAFRYLLSAAKDRDDIVRIPVWKPHPGRPQALSSGSNVLLKISR